MFKKYLVEILYMIRSTKHQKNGTLHIDRIIFILLRGTWQVKHQLIHLTSTLLVDWKLAFGCNLEISIAAPPTNLFSWIVLLGVKAADSFMESAFAMWCDQKVMRFSVHVHLQKQNIQRETATQSPAFVCAMYFPRCYSAKVREGI